MTAAGHVAPTLCFKVTLTNVASPPFAMSFSQSLPSSYTAHSLSTFCPCLLSLLIKLASVFPYSSRQTPALYTSLSVKAKRSYTTAAFAFLFLCSCSRGESCNGRWSGFLHREEEMGRLPYRSYGCVFAFAFICVATQWRRFVWHFNQVLIHFGSGLFVSFFLFLVSPWGSRPESLVLFYCKNGVSARWVPVYWLQIWNALYVYMDKIMRF